MTDFKSSKENELPPSISIAKFAAARSKEIQVMRNAVAVSSGTKLAFQKLPQHMRRRAMSHNVKRLPRRLREIHMNQMTKSGLPPKQKIPSRKHRRRPCNLLAEYMRRRRRCQWLNTHIWHAKRFHMIEKWGYKLPERPCNRSFRACYRATINHCLLQDISYNSCFEISGMFNEIVDGFKKITHGNLGLSIAAKPYISGRREGKITIFNVHDYKKAIGSVVFNWRSRKVNRNHVLWLWVHPAFRSEMLDNLSNCFNLSPVTMKEEYRFNIYVNSNNLMLKDLQSELTRFRLTGPLSNVVLKNCFKLTNEDTQIGWLKENKNDEYKKQIESRKIFLNKLDSITASELPPHIILPLDVLDPRFNIPKKRTKALPKGEAMVSTPCHDIPEVCDSAIWDEKVRKCVSEMKISNAQISEMRQKLLVPDSNDLDKKPDPVPVLLVQRPGKEKTGPLGYGSGFDIILPSSWAQPFWISLILWGARVGGLQESNSIDFESTQQSTLYPDTTAGAAEEYHLTSKYRESFFKLPPNKRTNFAKFSITSPLFWNWKLLVSDWLGKETQDFSVIRDKKLLEKFNELLNKKVFSVEYNFLEVKQDSLVPVCIKMSGKGSSKPFGIICLPSESDHKIEPVEPICVDSYKKVRKELRKEHKNLLARLRRQRVRAKRQGKVLTADMDMLKNYQNQMKKLWLPEGKNIRNSCSREVAGFVKEGDFSFVLGQSKAVGYITLGALLKLSTFKIRNKLLVRNTNSRQYRLGTLEIIYD